MSPPAVIRKPGHGTVCCAIECLQRFWQMRRKQPIWCSGRHWWQPWRRAEPERDQPCHTARRGGEMRLSVLPESQVHLLHPCRRGARLPLRYAEPPPPGEWKVTYPAPCATHQACPNAPLRAEHEKGLSSSGLWRRTFQGRSRTATGRWQAALPQTGQLVYFHFTAAQCPLVCSQDISHGRLWACSSRDGLVWGYAQWPVHCILI